MSTAPAAQSPDCLKPTGGWSPGPLRPALADAVLEVWQADLATAGDEPLELLTPTERARAACIERPHERELWSRGRGVLRALLGRYLQTNPRKLVLCTGEHGKPAVQGAELEFNLSHSGSLALYAFAARGAVGVDVQLMRDPARRERTDYLALADRTFGAEAAERLRVLAPEPREAEFMRMWTRHEAALKLHGLGLDAAGRVPAPDWEAELDLGPQATAVVAAARAPGELRLWRWAGLQSPAWPRV